MQDENSGDEPSRVFSSLALNSYWFPRWSTSIVIGQKKTFVLKYPIKKADNDKWINVMDQ